MENPAFIVACRSSDNALDGTARSPGRINRRTARPRLWTGRDRGFIPRPRRRPDGRVAMQRTANPRTAVRFRFRPPLPKSAFDIVCLFAESTPTGLNTGQKWEYFSESGSRCVADLVADGARASRLARAGLALHRHHRRRGRLQARERARRAALALRPLRVVIDHLARAPAKECFHLPGSRLVVGHEARDALADTVRGAVFG
jgi:hypothetical protein